MRGRAVLVPLLDMDLSQVVTMNASTGKLKTYKNVHPHPEQACSEIMK
jgi:hypothetical protein